MDTLSLNDLKGKTCVITGGAGVIGTSMSKGLASIGVKLAIFDLNKEQADKVAKEIADQYKITCIGVEANVLDKESLLKAKEIVNEKLGDIDLLINGAGGNSPAATTKVEQMSEVDLDNLDDTFFGLQMDGFRKVFDLNFLGTLLPTMVLCKDMLKNKKGVVLNVSSMNSYKPLTKIPAYSAAKCAINNFTEWLSVHLAKVGIRVNAIAPGFFLTNQNRFLLVDKETGEPTARGQKIIANTPMGRYGEVDELQGTVAYLLSDISQFVTGIVVPVDGGYSAFGGI